MIHSISCALALAVVHASALNSSRVKSPQGHQPSLIFGQNCEDLTDESVKAASPGGLVRLGSLADMDQRIRDVLFVGQSGHRSAHQFADQLVGPSVCKPTVRSASNFARVRLGCWRCSGTHAVYEPSSDASGRGAGNVRNADSVHNTRNAGNGNDGGCTGNSSHTGNRGNSRIRNTDSDGLN